jgi:hypothetical protein
MRTQLDVYLLTSCYKVCDLKSKIATNAGHSLTYHTMSKYVQTFYFWWGDYIIISPETLRE